jgi:hypothetical protein
MFTVIKTYNGTEESRKHADTLDAAVSLAQADTDLSDADADTLRRLHVWTATDETGGTDGLRIVEELTLRQMEVVAFALDYTRQHLAQAQHRFALDHQYDGEPFPPPTIGEINDTIAAVSDL